MTTRRVVCSKWLWAQDTHPCRHTRHAPAINATSDRPAWWSVVQTAHRAEARSERRQPRLRAPATTATQATSAPSPRSTPPTPRIATSATAPRQPRLHAQPRRLRHLGNHASTHSPLRAVATAPTRTGYDSHPGYKRAFTALYATPATHSHLGYGTSATAPPRLLRHHRLLLPPRPTHGLSKPGGKRTASPGYHYQARVSSLLARAATMAANCLLSEKGALNTGTKPVTSSRRLPRRACKSPLRRRQLPIAAAFSTRAARPNPRSAGQITGSSERVQGNTLPPRLAQLPRFKQMNVSLAANLGYPRV